MKLEHLIQAYNFNKIPAHLQEEAETIKDINGTKIIDETAGVIKFSENIFASYLLDEDGFVIALNLFINSLVGARGNNKKMTTANQIKHTTQSLIIIQKSIELLGNTKKEEANEILKALGLFSGMIKEKAVKFLNYIYKIDSSDGIIMFSILENNKNESLLNPPVKISNKKIS